MKDHNTKNWINDVKNYILKIVIGYFHTTIFGEINAALLSIRDLKNI